MTLGQEDEVRLTERAAQWFGALTESNTERAAFFDWLAESPRHVDAFLSILATAREIAELSPEQQRRIEELSDEIGATALPVHAGNVIPLPQRPTGNSAASEDTAIRRPPHKWSFGLAASLLILAGAAWLTHVAGSETYRTSVGEQRAVELADGSIVHLNTRSRLEVRFTGSTRNVRLVEGQALFKVQHDATRPFVVQSGNTTIQAVGTQFDVYQRPTETRVAVIEGRVRVSPAATGNGNAQLLSAGENVGIGADGGIVKLRPLEPTEAAVWRQRRLVFREDTLGDIAAEFNRYNSSLQIRVIGAAANTQHFSGTFDADAPETLAQALAGDSTLIVERSAHEIVIRANSNQ